MRVGDTVLYYHSVAGKAVVGIAKVTRAAYADPTADPGSPGGWVCIDLAPLKALAKPVSLEQIKEDPALKEIALVRQSRLSVMPVKAKEYQRILKLGGA
jgi:predicted RNA-binding protein with PUA-like domain